MPTNTESLNRELFRLLSKYKPKPLDAEGKATPIPDEADIFKFEFTKDGEDYGTVYVTLDEERVLTVYFGDDVADSPDDKTPGLDYDDTWSGLLHQLSAWRMTKGLKGFNTQNKDRVGDDMARRNHMRNKDKIAEGYYATGKKSSYSDAVPSVKIVIEHSRVIEEGEQRYRNINRIFLENQAGERYLLDTKKPGIARVYARHIAEGGKVNDDRWSHIGSLCEEYQKMAGFVRATRNGQFNESAQSLVNEGIAHYASLRESLSRMTGKRGYNAYFESWTPSLMEDGTEENNLNELFVQETLDPRIESVMPILNRIHKKVSESIVDKEMNKLAEWADSLSEEGGESLTSNNPIGIPEDEELDESEMDESALQAYLGDKKYGEKGMDALRAAGREHASKTKMQNIRAKFSNKEKDVAEALDPDTQRLEQEVRDALANGDDYTAKSLVKMAQTAADRNYLRKIIRQEMYGTGPGQGGIMEGDDGQVVFSGTGANGGKYKIIQTGPTDFMIHANGKHIDTYSSLQRAMSVLKNEVPGLTKGVAEGTGSSIERILAAHPEAVENFKQGGDLDYDLESDLWEYYFNNGEIRNYDADASEFISQRLADELGLSEGLDANQKRVGQLGPTEKVKNNNIGKLVGANESQLDEISQELAVKTLGKRRAHGMDGWGDDEAHRKADATEKRVEKKFGKDAVAAADKITDKELYGDRKMKENFINTVDQAVVSEEDEMAESILSAIKKVGKKVLDKVAPGDEELLKQLDKDAHGGKLPNRYNSDAESAKKYPADSWKVKVDESSDELARILTIMNHRR